MGGGGGGGCLKMFALKLNVGEIRVAAGHEYLLVFNNVMAIIFRNLNQRNGARGV